MKTSLQRLINRPLKGLALTALSLGVATSLQAAPSIEFGDEGVLNIGYALQLWAQHSSYTSATNDAAALDTYLRRNRITFSGQYNDLIGFYAQLEAGNDSKAGNDDRSIYYRDAYITFDYSDPLRLIVGRFKNTFSRENLEACLESLTLDRSDATYSPFGGSRDTGIALWGNLADAAFQYSIAIQDGREGEYVAEKNPRITTRVHWSLLDPEYDYGYRGTYLGTQRILTIGAAYDFQPGAAYGDWANLSDIKDYKAWTVDAFFEYPFDFGTVTLSTAYLNYSLSDAINQSPDPQLPSNTELESFYVKGGYLFPKPIGPGRLQIYARHDGSDYHLAGGLLDRQINSFGLNYYLNGQSLKLTLDHQRVDYANPVSGNAALQDNHQTTLGFQFIL